MAEFTKVTQFEKTSINESLGLVLGWAIVCKQQGAPYYDLQGDHIPEDAMMKCAAEFMGLTARTSTDMHGPAAGTVVFAWPMTTEVLKTLGYPTDKTGLLIAVKPASDELLEKYRRGEYTGFSIGGLRGEDEDVPDEDEDDKGKKKQERAA